jgi:hypothetical protein
LDWHGAKIVADASSAKRFRCGFEEQKKFSRDIFLAVSWFADGARALARFNVSIALDSEAA